MEMDLTHNAKQLLRIGAGDLARVIQHYNLTPRMLEDSLQNIKEWYARQPHLPPGQLGDEVIIRHLITRGFSVERTKEKIDMYYTARNLVPEFICSRDPLSRSVERAMRTIEFIPLPQVTEEQDRVTLIRITNPDTSMSHMVDTFKVAFMIGDYRIRNDLAIGDHWILEMSEARLGHVVQFTPALVTKSLFYIQSCIGVKIKGIHLVHLPSYCDVVVNMFKRGLKDKVASRIHTYRKFEDLFRIFPVNMFPKDFGGNERPSDEIAETWRRTLQSPVWRQWFIEQEYVVPDESKRPVQFSTPADLLGIQGSFRALDID